MATFSCSVRSGSPCCWLHTGRRLAATACNIALTAAFSALGTSPPRAPVVLFAASSLSWGLDGTGAWFSSPQCRDLGSVQPVRRGEICEFNEECGKEGGMEGLRQEGLGAHHSLSPHLRSTCSTLGFF
jgi:hypothetical protein